MKVFIVIDVEMCRVYSRPRGYPPKNEIIQIGAVMMDESYEMIDKFSVYVKPRFGEIDRFIATLTGISPKTIKGSPDIEEALRKLLEWIGDNEPVFYSWSATDYHQIRNEIAYKCQDKDHFKVLLNRVNWIDYQEKFRKRLGSSTVLNLPEALQLVEIDTKGRLHDGLDDAYNTAGLIAKLETRKDYQTLIERVRAKEKEQEPLTTSLGSLLGEMDLEA